MKIIINGNINMQILEGSKFKKFSFLGWGFSGCVPLEIFNISSLQVISMAENFLYGNIPYYMCNNLGGLRQLDLARTTLYGPILLHLSNCSQLEALSLTNTNFGGVMPQELGNLKSLQELYLAYTNLTGPYHPLLSIYFTFCTSRYVHLKV